MIRSFCISWGGHTLLFVVLVTMSLLAPPARPAKQIVSIHMIQGGTSQPLPRLPLQTQPSAPVKPLPPIQTPAPAPVQTPAPKPTAAPEPPKPKPQPTAAPEPKPEAKATPKPAPKKAEEKKQIVEKADIVKPNPKPSPAPEVASATPPPGPTPKPTPFRPPAETGATPQGTPAPKTTPGPAPVIPSGLIPNLPPGIPGAVPGPLIPGAEMIKLGDAYNAIALFYIQQNFKPPRSRPDTKCEVQFRIMRDGEVRDIKIVKATGQTDLDQAAVKALRDTARLPELAEAFPDEFIDVKVTFEFDKEQ